MRRRLATLAITAIVLGAGFPGPAPAQELPNQFWGPMIGLTEADTLSVQFALGEPRALLPKQVEGTCDAEVLVDVIDPARLDTPLATSGPIVAKGREPAGLRLQGRARSAAGAGGDPAARAGHSEARRDRSTAGSATCSVSSGGKLAGIRYANGGDPAKRE